MNEHNPSEFEFYIKAYREKGLISNVMENLAVGESVRLFGPLGLGLQLTESFL